MTRDHRNAERGQALPEFALIAPLLFLLLFGVIQLGLLMAAQNGLENGVRDSARRAATYRVSDQSFGGGLFGTICANVELELVDRLRDEVVGFIDDPGRLSTTIQYVGTDDFTSGEYSIVVDVSVSYAAPLYIPLVGLVLNPSDPANFTLGASEQMRVENPPLTVDLSAQTC